MRTKRKVLLLALIAAMAVVIPASQSSASNNPPWFPPFDGGGDGGNTCAFQCPDGSWSGIACNNGETAVCSCSGSPVQANPHCLPPW